MIVISGALVLVALVLLVIGVVGPDLTFVYASIAVSLVSLVFLVIGILQRRGETAPAAEAAPVREQAPDAESEGVTTVLPAQGSGATASSVEEPAPVAETVDEELETGGTVLIVEGRPRYHVDGCRYLNNKTAEKIDVLDAREEGFTPCGVCKPDDALDALQDEPALEEPAAEEPAVEEEPAVDPEPVVVPEPVVEEDVPGVEVPPARTQAPAKKAARKAPAKKAATGTRTVAPAPAPVKSPSRARSASTAKAAATAATPAAATARKTGSVVVIPDRGKFHRAECRYVRDVDGAEAMSKSAASRQGYAACGVCKP